MIEGGLKVEYRPDFIIIGAMKCATSTLHDQLNMHDSIFMTTPKEPNFFSDNLVYTKGFQWYESLYVDATCGQLKGESSTHYSKLPQYPETVDRMVAYCPDLKCIYVMRHPVDRLVSHYIHEWTQGIISCGIDMAVDRFQELIQYGQYNMQIEPYLNAFGCSRVLPLFAERLRENPLREMQTIFEFLDIGEKPTWHTEITSNVSAERLRVCVWRDIIVNNTLLRFLRQKFVSKKLRRMVRHFWSMNERPELSMEVLKRIQTVFDKDLKKLGEKLGLELNCENFKQQICSQKKIMWDI